MHRCGVKTSLLNPSTTDHHYHHRHYHHHHHQQQQQQQQPLCPKPRRSGYTNPELLVAFGCTQHNSQPNGDGRSGTLSLILDKGMETRDSACSGCPPPCYSGSPPSRTDNPLIHDVQFIRQSELLSPFTRTNLSDKFRFPV